MTDEGIINDICLQEPGCTGLSGVSSLPKERPDCGSEVCSAGDVEERPSDDSESPLESNQTAEGVLGEDVSEPRCGWQTAISGEMDDSGKGECLSRGGHEGDTGNSNTRPCNDVASNDVELRRDELNEVSRESGCGDSVVRSEDSRVVSEDESSVVVDSLEGDSDSNSGTIDFIKSSLMAEDSDKIASTLGFDEEIPNLDQKKEDISSVNLGNTTSSNTSDNKAIKFVKSDVGLGIIASVVLLVLAIIYRVKIANTDEVVINVGEPTAMLKLCMVYLGSVLSTLGMFLLAPAGIIGNLVSIKVPTKLMKLLNYGLIVFAFLLLVCIFI